MTSGRGGGHAELLIGPTRWVAPRLALRAVVGPSLEGYSGDTLPLAVQAPVEAGFLLDAHRLVRIDAHARAASNLAVDPLRRGGPHHDYSVGVDLFLGRRNGGDTPMVVLGSEMRWTMEDRRVGFTLAVGAAD